MKRITFNKIRYHEQRDMIDWCVKSFGPGSVGHICRDNEVWCFNTMFGNSNFCFKEDKDYNWFVLRWS